MKSKVLILSAIYPPRGGSCVQRVYYFSEYLAELGHEVWVVTEGIQRFWASDHHLCPKAVRSDQIIRIPLYPSSIIRAVDRLLARFLVSPLYPDSHVLWAIGAYRAALKIIDREKIESLVVNLGHPSALWCAFRLKQERPQLRLHVDIQDVWAGNPTSFQGRHQLWPIRSIDAALERRFLANADQITVIEQGMANQIIKTHPEKASQVSVLPHGYDEETFRAVLSVHDSHKVQPDRPTCVFRYLGFAHPDMRMDNFFSAIAHARNSDERQFRDVQFEFIGGSPGTVRELARASAIEDLVRAVDYVEHSEAVRLMLDADVLLLFWTSDPSCVCGKLYEYIRANRFILASAQGNPDGQRLIEESRRGQWINAFNITEQTRTIQQLVESVRNGNELLKVEKLPDIDHLDRRNIVKSLSLLLEFDGAQEVRQTA